MECPEGGEGRTAQTPRTASREAAKFSGGISFFGVVGNQSGVYRLTMVTD
jgi:hypothetical protein